MRCGSQNTGGFVHVVVSRVLRPIMRDCRDSDYSPVFGENSHIFSALQIFPGHCSRTPRSWVAADEGPTEGHDADHDDDVADDAYSTPSGETSSACTASASGCMATPWPMPDCRPAVTRRARWDKPPSDGWLSTAALGRSGSSKPPQFSQVSTTHTSRHLSGRASYTPHTPYT